MYSTVLTYEELVHRYFGNGSQLAETFLELVPTPATFKKMAKDDFRALLEVGDPKIADLIIAIQLGEVILKSPDTIIGHAYSSRIVGMNYIDQYAGDDQESITVLCTDVHNEIIAQRRLFSGGHGECSVFPDYIFRYAIKNCAHSIILVHNHPTGNVAPSDNDLRMCTRLERAGNLLGIHLLDFIIVGGTDYYSWRENLPSE